jgi:AcrR family transcriptional regulator
MTSVPEVPPEGAGGERGLPETAHRLLLAGRRLFAQQGFEGTSVRALTREADANLGAVTYHFETKEELYRAVLDMVLAPVRGRLELLGGLPLPAPERLELFVRGMFQHLRENRDIPRFFVQEIVLGDDPSPPILNTVRTVVGTLAKILKEGQEEGSVVPGDPVLMALTFLSQPIYLSLMPAFLERENQRGSELPQPDHSAEEHAVAFLRRAFAVPEEDD